MSYKYLGRILGIDFGLRRTGLALSDSLHITAQPLETCKNRDKQSLIDTIVSTIVEQDIEKIVIGYPLTLKGETGRMADLVNEFIDQLSSCVQIPILRLDERFTTKIAHQSLHLMGKKPSREKEKVDMIAAAILLQNYLDGVSASGRDSD